MMQPSFLVATLLLVASVGPSDRPPKPTFKKHIDYVAWYEKYLDAGSPADNAIGPYRKFWPDSFPTVLKSTVPEIPPNIKEQLDKAIGAGWTKEQYPELAAWVEEAQPYIQILRRAAQLPRLWLPVPSGEPILVDVMDSVCDRSRNTAKAMLADAWLDRPDRSSRLLEAHKTVLVNVSHLRQGRTLVSWLSSCGNEALVCGSIRAAFSENISTTNQIGRIYECFYQNAEDGTSLVQPMIFMWTMDLADLQLYCPEGKLDRDLWKPANAEAEDPSSADFADFEPAETVQLVDEYHAGAVKILSRPLTVTVVGQMVDYEAKMKPNITRNAFARQSEAGRGVARTCQLALRTEVFRRGTLVTLAVLAHHFKHDEWPASLKQVDKKVRPKGYKQICVDPCSGKSFVYRLENGKPLLYSIGVDGKDDGGRHDGRCGESEGGGGDYVLCPYQK